MNRYGLYGWRGVVDLWTAAGRVTRATGVEFDLHNSYFLGGDYFCGTSAGGAEVMVRPNAEDEEGELIESEFPEHRTLVYVNDCDDDTASALARVEGLEHLRTRTH